MVNSTDFKNLIFEAFKNPTKHAKLYRNLWNNKVVSNAKGCGWFYVRKLSFNELIGNISDLQKTINNEKDRDKLSDILAYILDQKQKHLNERQKKIKNTKIKILKWFLKNWYGDEKSSLEAGKKHLTLTKEQRDRVKQLVEQLVNSFFTDLYLSDEYLQSFKRQVSSSTLIAEAAGKLFAEKVKSLVKLSSVVNNPAGQGLEDAIDANVCELPNWKNIFNIQQICRQFDDQSSFAKGFYDLTIKISNETILTNTDLLSVQCGYPFTYYKKKVLNLSKIYLRHSDLSSFFNFMKTGKLPLEDVIAPMEKLQFISGDCDIYFDFHGPGTLYTEKLELTHILGQISFNKPEEAGEALGYLWKIARKYELKKETIHEFYYAQCISIIGAYQGKDMLQKDKDLFIQGFKKALKYNYGRSIVKLEYQAIKTCIDKMLLEAKKAGITFDYNINQQKRVVLISSIEKRGNQPLNSVLLKAFFNKYAPVELYIEFPIASEDVETLKACVTGCPFIKNQILWGTHAMVGSYCSAQVGNIEEVNDLGGVLQRVEELFQFKDRIRILPIGENLIYDEANQVWKEKNNKSQWEPYSNLVCHYPHPFSDPRRVADFLDKL